MIPFNPRALKALFNAVIRANRKIVTKEQAPGIIVGLSGTDSILTFLICFEIFKRLGKPHRVMGVHYGLMNSSFAMTMAPWLGEKAPGAQILVKQVTHHRDGFRWGDLHDHALGDIHTDERWNPEERYWVSGTRNATEDFLGLYSNISSAVSIQPIINLWKSEVLQLCHYLGVPQSIIDKSYFTDCSCGNTDHDLIAMNPTLVDDVIYHRQCNMRISDLYKQYGKDDVKEMVKIVERQAKRNSFKTRIPHQNAFIIPKDA